MAAAGWTNFTTEELVAEMVDYVNQDIKRVKMKVGKDFGTSEREDIERVAAVRQAVGDDVALYVDANNGYYPKQAVYMAREFEAYQIGWFEGAGPGGRSPGSRRYQTRRWRSGGFGRARVHQVRVQGAYRPRLRGYRPA